jgi:hypothetical protein
MRGALLKDISKIRNIKPPPKIEPKPQSEKSSVGLPGLRNKVPNIPKTGPPNPEEHGYAFDSPYIADDIVREFFSYLDGYYIARCAAVCKRWRSVTGILLSIPRVLILAESEELWRMLVQSNFKISKVKFVLLDQMDKNVKSWRMIYM